MRHLYRAEVTVSLWVTSDGNPDADAKRAAREALRNGDHDVTVDTRAATWPERPLSDAGLAYGAHGRDLETGEILLAMRACVFLAWCCGGAL